MKYQIVFATPVNGLAYNAFTPTHEAATVLCRTLKAAGWDVSLSEWTKEERTEGGHLVAPNGYQEIDVP